MRVVFIIPQFDVLVYNPLARGNDNIVVRLPVSRRDLGVMATSMVDVPCQVMGSPSPECSVHNV